MMKQSLSPYLERKSLKALQLDFFCKILKEIKDFSCIIDNGDVFSYFHICIFIFVFLYMYLSVLLFYEMADLMSAD